MEDGAIGNVEIGLRETICGSSGLVVVSTGATTDSVAGSIELVGGTSDKGQGRDVDICGVVRVPLLELEDVSC